MKRCDKLVEVAPPFCAEDWLPPHTAMVGLMANNAKAAQMVRC